MIITAVLRKCMGYISSSKFYNIFTDKKFLVWAAMLLFPVVGHVAIIWRHFLRTRHGLMIENPRIAVGNENAFVDLQFKRVEPFSPQAQYVYVIEAQYEG